LRWRRDRQSEDVNRDGIWHQCAVVAWKRINPVSFNNQLSHAMRREKSGPAKELEKEGDNRLFCGQKEPFCVLLDHANADFATAIDASARHELPLAKPGASAKSPQIVSPSFSSLARFEQPVVCTPAPSSRTPQVYSAEAGNSPATCKGLCRARLTASARPILLAARCTIPWRPAGKPSHQH
jgi:hypothetical protein